MVLRRDLPLGVLAAQAVHAAGESSPGNLPEGTYAVVLAVPDEPALRTLEARLRMAGVAFRSIVEVDEPYAGALMALGLEPRPRSAVSRLLSSIPLLREVRQPST